MLKTSTLEDDVLRTLSRRDNGEFRKTISLTRLSINPTFRKYKFGEGDVDAWYTQAKLMFNATSNTAMESQSSIERNFGWRFKSFLENVLRHKVREFRALKAV